MEQAPVSEENPDNAPLVAPMSESQAQQKFAQILSKAVYGSKDLRQFLKKNALQQFDNDYDVFYPKVKDATVADGQTVRDVLLSYCDADSLTMVENSLPLLNILVPDLTLLSDFNAESWNTDDPEIAVGYKEENKNVTLYADGDSVANLAPADYPAFPVLFVKNNDRLVVKTPATRSAAATYEFIDEAFDGSKHPMTRATTELDWYPDAIADEYIPASLIDSSLLIKAWDEKVPYAVQRDYLYYGLSKDHPENGAYNSNVREAFYQFSLNPNANISQEYDNDATFVGADITKIGPINKNSALTTDEIRDKLWTDGNFEFFFDVYKAVQGSTYPGNQKIHVTIPPKELFGIKKYHVKYTTNIFYNRYVYTVSKDDLMSKWVTIKKYTGSGLQPYLTWDISKDPLILYVTCIEHDPGTKYTTNHTFESSFTTNSSFGFDGTANVKVKASFGISTTEKKGYTVSAEITDTDDDLGAFYIDYRDPVIVGQRTLTPRRGRGSTLQYKIFGYTCGDLSVRILPVDIFKNPL
jgi:hypothetical protein